VSAPTSTAVIRTLLLTDLCDSVALVERMGDAASAELFQAHDVQVMRLLQQWQGRLIDRSDGLLLLFERPLHGIGFAIDYLDALDALGRQHAVLLRARAGLHVGEVLTWNNSSEAVCAGAKLMEVEGLAKPTAARLMSLARPGQILLSSVAEALVRRSAHSELGHLGDQLVWRCHGRWRLKGVPTAQEVHEVGRTGKAPLRMPVASAKAWRDLPLWRRPTALIMQVLLLAGLGAGGWIATRSEPAIAFDKRDWVVLAELHNSTGNGLLEDSLEQAFRISLEQSHHINVLSDLKVQMTLARMEQGRAARFDRASAAEVALRDGARLVVVPMVSEIGGRLRFTVELVDPATLRTLAVERADARSAGDVLDTIDQVTQRVRGRLGEVMSEVQGNSQPLPNVTTRSLDALRAYALGKSAFVGGQFDKALGHYRQATEIDPEFALAHLGVLTALNALERLPEAAPHIEAAVQLRSRLPTREQLYLDAWMVQMSDLDGIYAVWSQLSDLYPDYSHAAMNTAFALEAGNRWRDIPRYSQRAAGSQSEAMAIASESEGRAELAMGNWDKAEAAFRRAAGHGLPSAAVWIGNVLAAQGKYAQAEAAWPAPESLKVAYFDLVTVLLDQGKNAQALTAARQLLGQTSPGSSRNRQGQLMLAVAEHASGDTAQARRTLRAAIRASAAAMERGGSMKLRYPDAVVIANAGLLADRLGEPGLLAQALRLIEGQDDLARQRGIQQWIGLLQARQQAAAGKPQQAAERIAASLDAHAFFQAHVTLRDLWLRAGNAEAAAEQQRWMRNQRGHAYAEYANCGWCTQALNVYDSRQAQLAVDPGAG
jgi:putative peptide modification system cyclase